MRVFWGGSRCDPKPPPPTPASSDEELAKELREIMARAAVIQQALSEAGWSVFICVDTSKKPYRGSASIDRRREL